MGIEPTWPAWKAGALPLSYTRRSCGPGWVRTTVGITPADLQSAAINHSATDPLLFMFWKDNLYSQNAILNV